MTPSKLPAILTVALAATPAAFPQNDSLAKDTIILSPFVVEAVEDRGYVASESITGTRVATKIADLPYNVNVITSEFLDDFAFFDIGSDLGYTSSLEGLDNAGGSYNLRGNGATFLLRNGFYRLGMVDRVNVDRVEIIKGPSAAIYGQSSPGGLINIITKRPKFEPAQDFSVTVGEYDTLRAEATATGPLGGGKTAYLFAASMFNREFDEAFSEQKNRTASLALEHRFSRTSSLLAELEWMERDGTPTSDVPYYYDGQSRTYTGLAEELKNFSVNGPRSRQLREVYTATLTYENRLNDVWNVRVSGNAYDRKGPNFNNTGADQFQVIDRRGNVIADPFISGRRGNYTIRDEDGVGLQADALAHYKLADGRIDNKTLFTVDLAAHNRHVITRRPASGFADLFPSNPDYSDMPAEYSEEVYSNISSADDNSWDVFGLFVRHQSAFFANRLIAFGSLRYDRVPYKLTPVSANLENGTPGLTNRYTSTAWSPSIGFNYKLTRHLSFYANRSESFTPQGQVAKGGQTLPNETADGYDYGIKATLLDERLLFTLGGFYIERDGVKVTDENGDDVAGGNHVAKGVEFDFTWNITDNLTLLGGYGYVHARIVSSGRDLDVVGRRPRGLPEDNGGVALKYSFSGALKGLSVNAGVKYVGASYPDSQSSARAETSGPYAGYVIQNDGRREVRVSSYTTLDLGASYSIRPKGSDVRHVIRVNLKNALDEEYITGRRSVGDRQAFYITYSLRH